MQQVQGKDKKNANFSYLKLKKIHLECKSKQVKEVTVAHSKYVHW